MRYLKKLRICLWLIVPLMSCVGCRDGVNQRLASIDSLMDVWPMDTLAINSGLAEVGKDIDGASERNRMYWSLLSQEYAFRPTYPCTQTAWLAKSFHIMTRRVRPKRTSVRIIFLAECMQTGIAMPMRRCSFRKPFQYTEKTSSQHVTTLWPNASYRWVRFTATTQAGIWQCSNIGMGCIMHVWRKIPQECWMPI